MKGEKASKTEATHVDGGEHILEGHVGQEQKDGSVDVHYTHLR